jgi:hypothetical protein
MKIWASELNRAFSNEVQMAKKKKTPHTHEDTHLFNNTSKNGLGNSTKLHTLIQISGWER